MIEPNEKQELEHLKQLAEPLVEYLKNEKFPHCAVVITEERIQLVRTEMSSPTKYCKHGLEFIRVQ